MTLHYGNNKLKKILTEERLIQRYYSNSYNNIINRLSELRSANCLLEISELPPPRRHKLIGNKADMWGICISKNYRIILKPFGVYDINDLTTITEVEIIDIEDYH